MLRLLFPYLLFGFLLLVVVLDPRGRTDVVTTDADDAAAVTADCHGANAGSAAVSRDPVCNMDVGDGIAAVHLGVTHYFCTERCRDLFVSDPDLYLTESCPVCLAEDDARVAVGPGNPEFTWQGKTWRFCGVAHRDAFGEDPAGYFMHTMWGIPSWLYAVSIGVVLVLSFGLFELIARRGRAASSAAPRLDLFRFGIVARLLRSRFTRTIAQLVFVAAFALIVIAGLFGNQLPSKNVAPLLTWTIWWGGLVLVIMFAGKAWCYVCPWDAIAGWVERALSWGRSVTGGASLGLRWPRRLRNITLATVLFVGLTWLELGFGVTTNPRTTALLGLAMVTMTVVSVLLFERRAFCRYACLVGRVSGLYALFSASEVRPADPNACRDCKTKDCYHGNDRGVGCPTHVYPGALHENTYCITCMECTRTCPKENMVVRARPFAADLAAEGRPRKDEAYLALLMLAITGFHGLTMTPVWRELLDAFHARLGLSHIPAFTLGMALLLAAPILTYAVLVRVTCFLARTPRVTYRQAFIRFAYSLLPIALFYHLAHNLEHLLMEGQKILPLLSNPLGYVPGQSWSILGFSGVGPWNLLGTKDWNPAPLVSLPTLWTLQALLVLVGHVYSLWIADRTARRLYPGGAAAFRSQLPMLVGMVLFSIFSLWLLKQPMEMRTSAM